MIKNDDLFYEKPDWNYPNNINIADLLRNDLSFEALGTKVEIWLDNFCYLGIYPELFLILSISILIVFLVIIDSIYNYKVFLARLTGYLLILIFFLCILLLNNININFFIFFDSLIIDKFNNLIKIIVLISLIISIYISFNYLKFEKITQYEYFLLIGLSSIGMLTIISSNDLITMYIGIEIQSLCFYVLATIKIYNNFSTEAGLKYFILGAFASGLLLLGCSFIYGSIGITNFTEIYTYCRYNVENINLNTLTLGIFLIVISLLFKLGAAPFHMWLPDVYEGVPTTITALFSIVPKIAIFSLFLKLSVILFSFNKYILESILMYSCLLSIIIGTLGALYQTKIKRLLAYSAISHVGFLLIGFYSLNNWSFFSLFFYIIIYIIISINIFTFILILRKIDNNLKLKKINEFVILFKSNPLLAINFALILFSIAGIPPLVGFYSKLYIFISAIKSEIYLIALIAAIFSVIASLYYIRLIKLMFFKPIEYWAFFFPITKGESLILALTCIFNVFFFCFPEILIISLYNIILETFI